MRAEEAGIGLVGRRDRASRKSAHNNAGAINCTS